MSAFLARFKTDLAPLLVVADDPNEALDALKRAEVATPDELIELPSDVLVAFEVGTDRHGFLAIEALDELDEWLEKHADGDESDAGDDADDGDESDADDQDDVDAEADTEPEAS